MKTNQKNSLILPLGVKWLMLYILLLALGSCSSCKKEVDALPPETQTGANTFGALIDGKAYIPQKNSGFGASDPIWGGYIGNLQSYTYRNNVCVTTRGGGASFTIFLRNVNKIGAYPLNFDTGPYPQEFYPQNYGSCTTSSGFYTTTTTHTGVVEITRADTINNIVSGRFSFTGVDRTTGKTIQITDGRFDL